MSLRPKEGDNGKYGYVDLYDHYLNWRLSGEKIDLNTPEFKILPIFEEAGKFEDGFAEVKMNGKWGVISEDGEFIIEPQCEDIVIYEEAGMFGDGFAEVKMNGKWGVVNEDGKFIIEPQYEDIVKRKNGLYRVKVDGKWGLINEHEEIIHEPQYDEVGKCHDNLIDVKIGNKIGFINLRWQLIVEPQFDSFHFYDDIDHSYRLMRVEIGEKKGLIDTKDGHYIFEPQFDFIGDKVFCWFLRIKKNGKWGIVRTNGEVIAEPIYDEIDGFEEHIGSHLDLAKVRIDDKWGVINRKGEYIIEPQPLTIDVRVGYRSIFVPLFKSVNFIIGDKSKIYLIESKFIADEVYFNDFYSYNSYNSARFVADGKMGFVDDLGKIFIEPKFDDSEAFSNGYAKVKVQGKWGLIDRNGDYCFKPQFDVVEPLKGDVGRIYDNAKVKIDGKWGIINRQGVYVVEPRFDEINEDSVFINDNWHLFVWVRMGEKWGLIKDHNLLVGGCVFDEIKGFDHGGVLAAVRVGHKWGCINHQYGRLVANPKFDEIRELNYSGDLAAVRVGLKWGCINQHGRLVANPKFDEIKRFDSIGLAAVRVGLKWGYINDTGCYSIEPEFDEVDFFDYTTELAAVRVGDKWGFINRSGQFVIEPKFEYAEKFEYGLALIKIDGKSCCVDKFGQIHNFDYYFQNKAKNNNYYASYYGSAQESADAGWDMIAGDAGFDTDDYDVDSLREYLGMD